MVKFKEKGCASVSLHATFLNWNGYVGCSLTTEGSKCIDGLHKDFLNKANSISQWLFTPFSTYYNFNLNWVPHNWELNSQWRVHTFMVLFWNRSCIGGNWVSREELANTYLTVPMVTWIQLEVCELYSYVFRPWAHWAISGQSLIHRVTTSQSCKRKWRIMDTVLSSLEEGGIKIYR